MIDEGARIGAILRACTADGFSFGRLNGHRDTPIGKS
jgi:hypothetical protein